MTHTIYDGLTDLSTFRVTAKLKGREARVLTPNFFGGDGRDYGDGGGAGYGDGWEGNSLGNGYPHFDERGDGPRNKNCNAGADGDGSGYGCGNEHGDGARWITSAEPFNG